MWHQWFIFNFMKLWEYFLCAKKTKIPTLFNNFFASSQSPSPFTRVPWRMRVMLLMQEPAFWCLVYGSCEWWQRLTGREELLNKVVIFVFFAHKKYSRSFIKLQLNHWCHMDMVVPLLSMQGQKALRFHQNILICVLKANKGLGTTWGWVINDNFHFWVNYPLKPIKSKAVKALIVHVNWLLMDWCKSKYMQQHWPVAEICCFPHAANQSVDCVRLPGIGCTHWLLHCHWHHLLKQI